MTKYAQDDKIRFGWQNTLRMAKYAQDGIKTLRMTKYVQDGNKTRRMTATVL